MYLKQSCVDTSATPLGIKREWYVSMYYNIILLSDQIDIPPFSRLYRRINLKARDKNQQSDKETFPVDCRKWGITKIAARTLNINRKSKK
jgi:hypothetical protein